VSGFRQVDEREIWSGFVYRLVAGTFESPSGDRFERFVFRTSGAVSVVPIVYAADDAAREEPRVVLISQYRAAHDEIVVEIPAGVRDVEGEADEDNARRELVEEVGLIAGRIEPLGTIYPSAGMTDSTNSIFLATELTPTAASPHGPEERHSEVFDIPLREAIEWIESSRIVDAKSVVGILLAERRLRGG
jgi:ADP-ribose pyrophosphatase